MADPKFYQYDGCDTCKKARKFLQAQDFTVRSIPIVDQPPSLAELKKMLGYLKAEGGTLKQLFNTSGVQYRELKISEKLKAGMTEGEALELLSKNGKLIKRPFLLADSWGTVGFKEASWKDLIR